MFDRSISLVSLVQVQIINIFLPLLAPSGVERIALSNAIGFLFPLQYFFFYLPLPPSMVEVETKKPCPPLSILTRGLVSSRFFPRVQHGSSLLERYLCFWPFLFLLS